jgi:hypothetical protein
MRPSPRPKGPARECTFSAPMRERQKDGIAPAKQLGKDRGRVRKLSLSQVQNLLAQGKGVFRDR